MQDSKLYYWHDGILEETAFAKENCSHLYVIFLNGVPIASAVYSAQEVVRKELAPLEPETV